MEFLTLGSTETIGASCHYVNIGGTGLILDAGVDLESEGAESLPEFRLLRGHMGRPVDHCIVTHAHHDHLGGLPVLVQHFPRMRVHMTPPTQLLAEVLLPASARLQRRRVMEGSTTAKPIFDTEITEALSFLYETHELETAFELPGSGADVRGCFYHAGHILGAAGFYFEAEEDGRLRRCFYTSDTSLHAQLIQPGAVYPEGPIDVLILETTLGADPSAEQTTRADQERAFAEALARTIERGGVALVPVFALGRAQEVVAMLDRFKKQGLIPSDTPVYTTGSMRAIADLYDRTRHTTPRLNPEFEVFGVEQKRMPRSNVKANEILALPGIHVASSGMMFENTLSHALAQKLVEDEKNGIFLVGFAKEGSPAERVLSAAQQGKGTPVELDPLRGPQPVNCEVARFRFSGHSHRRDLLELVGRVKPDTIVLVHGEPEAKEWIREHAADAHPGVEVLLPRHGQDLIL